MTIDELLSVTDDDGFARVKYRYLNRSNQYEIGIGFVDVFHPIERGDVVIVRRETDNSWIRVRKDRLEVPGMKGEMHER